MIFLVKKRVFCFCFFFHQKIWKFVFQSKMFFIQPAVECWNPDWKPQLSIMRYMFLNFFLMEFILEVTLCKFWGVYHIFVPKPKVKVKVKVTISGLMSNRISAFMLRKVPMRFIKLHRKLKTSCRFYRWYMYTPYNSGLHTKLQGHSLRSCFSLTAKNAKADRIKLLEILSYDTKAVVAWDP